MNGLQVRALFLLEGKGGEVLADRSTLSPTKDRKSVLKDGAMIIFVCANLKEIFKEQRHYAWPKPEVCPRCKMRKPWGHGFVLAYFDGFSSGIYLRRYRCPECCCVIRLRPKGYFARFQASIKTIRSHVARGGYGAGISRSRLRYWLKALLRNTVAYLGYGFKGGVVAAFDRLVAMGKVPVACVK